MASERERGEVRAVLVLVATLELRGQRATLDKVLDNLPALLHISQQEAKRVFMRLASDGCLELKGKPGSVFYHLTPAGWSTLGQLRISAA